MPYILRNILAGFVLLVPILQLNSQTGVIRGKVMDAESSEAIIHCLITIKDLKIAGITDLDGFFSFENLDPGTYVLQVSHIGYEPMETEMELRIDDILFQSLYLKQSAIQLSVVDISAKQELANTQVLVSKISLSRAQLRTLPSVGGDADLIQYLQFVPGIINTGDRGGQIYIRGGSPVQNKILLDGLEIYNPFHSIGMFSVFDTELIRNVDIYTGGFPANYGGRISSIIDVSMREGNKSKFKSVLTANPFILKGTVEGPLIKKLNEDATALSFLFSMKQSIIAETSPVLYEYASIYNDVGLPYDFSDVFGKFSYSASNGSKVNVFGFNFEDSFDDRTSAKIKWMSRGAAINFDIIPNYSSTIIQGILGYSSYDTRISEINGIPRMSSIKNFKARMDFSSFGNDQDINYGFELNFLKTDFEFHNPFKLIVSQFQNTTELSSYITYRRVLTNLILEPGFRIQYYASSREFSLEPRIAGKYLIRNNLRFKFSGGLYSQNLLSASTERDVINIFTAFLTGPESSIRDFDGIALSDKLQKTSHLVAGLEFDLNSANTIQTEVYWKDFTQLLIVNRNKLNASDSDFAIETGTAKGIEISGQYHTSNLNASLAYSLAEVIRDDGTEQYYTSFDRRHNLNVLVNYAFGGSKNFEISGRWNFGSGFPFTQTQGFYNLNPFFEGSSTSYETDNPEVLGIIYAESRNNGRLPYYHRLDINLRKKFSIFSSSILEINLNFANVYNRDNIFYFNRVSYQRVDQLPFIPSLGIKLEL